jgi:hypothetical protein
MAGISGLVKFGGEKNTTMKKPATTLVVRSGKNHQSKLVSWIHTFQQNKQ